MILFSNKYLFYFKSFSDEKTITLFSLLIAISTVTAQQSHTLTAFDHGFIPDTLYMAPGDTVHFISQGYHSATEVDSIDWTNNTLNSNGGFDVGFGATTTNMWFIVNTPGKHYYMCRPHASMGMKGMIYIDQGTGIEEKYHPNNFNFYAHGDNSYLLQYIDSDAYKIFSLQGQLILNGELDKVSQEAIINCDLSNGTYILQFFNDDHMRVSKKFIK